MNAEHEGSLPAAVSTVARSSFPAFVCLFAALFLAFGTESPFLPSFLGLQGLTASEIGLVLTGGTIVRLASGPFLGSLADWVGATRVLAVTAGCAGLFGLAYLGGHSVGPLLCICMLHSVAVTPLSALSDALALNASAEQRVFAYGWVRGVGSAAFIIGTLLSGRLVASYGIASIIPASSIFFLMMMLAVRWIPSKGSARREVAAGGIRLLLGDATFRRVLLAAGLVIGSHAMSDTFAVIQWREAGLGADKISLLWSEAVLSEVIIFFLVGPSALDRFGAPACATIAAAAGIVRWAILALTSSTLALVLVQSLHGLTFALMHLACMRLITALAPPRLAATAQSLYGTFCLGIAAAVLTYLSGILYGKFGASAFWLMALLCLAALPIAVSLPGRKALAAAALFPEQG